jgi:NAD-dependent protein deacetylase/lipoamidase
MEIGPYQRIVILTGAGVSVASGLRPFRGPDGLWSELELADLSSASAIRERPADVWRLYGGLRRQALTALPNPAHAAIADFQRSQAAKSITLITQNVDGLHQRAGSRNVIDLHGSLLRTRCTLKSCELAPFPDEQIHADRVPACPRCRSPLRPDIVLFDEPLPAEAEWQAKRALRDCDLFLAIGTSGTVYPAAGFVRSALYAGAHTMLINIEPSSPKNPAFREEIIGRAEELLPALLR